MSFYLAPRYLMRRHILEKLLKKLDCKGKKLLEIGYGAGEIFNLYNSLGIKCYGYDFSEEAYQFSLKSNYNIPVTYYLREEDIEKNKFDIIVACEVLEHIKNDKETLLKWKSYLKKRKKGGGVLLYYLFQRTKIDGGQVMFS